MGATLKYRHYSFWFGSLNDSLDLKNKSIKGGINTTASQFISFFLNLVSTVVLARILLPNDFGLIGMVTAFTGLANIIKDVGLSTAVIQKEVITPKEVSNLFWINLIICIGLALVFVLISPLIVAFYHYDNRIFYIVYSYSAGMAISGLGIQHNALLCRKMLFSQIAKANIFASILSVIFGIVAGLMGLGYWAIVILNMSNIIFNTLFVWIYCDWRPSFPSKKQRIHSYLKFGAGISGFNIINYFARYSDDMLIGNMLGPTAVGFYSKAYQLLMLPINQLRNPLMTVAIPAISKLKNEPIRFVNYYKRYVFILAFFSMPIIACLAVFSKEVVIIILGHNWLESSSIFKILAIAGFIQPVSSSSGLVMISMGKTKKFFIVGCASSLVIVLGFIIGIHWGVIGTAVSFAITTYLILIPVLIYSFRDTPLKISHFFEEISSPILHTMFLGGLLMGFKFIFTMFFDSTIVFLIASPIGFALYYLSWFPLKSDRSKLMQINELIGIILSKVRLRERLRFLGI